MEWNVRLSQEVTEWYLGLSEYGVAEADVAFERLRERGNSLSMPHSRALSQGLFELRFMCEGRATRITYSFEPNRNVITLTQFVKQKNNEQKEVLRARKALRLARISRQDGE